MAANKVVFGNKVLIDLTGDTVTEEALLKGYTAHKADGTIITGTAFAGYPNEFVFLDNIQDSSGNPIKDSSGKTIQGQTIYRKARNSVLLDSTGDVIEDGFEQQIEVVKFVWMSFISRLFLHLNPLGTVNAGQFVFRIALCSCVIILSGMYVAYSEWIDYEIDTAIELGKPIIGVRPRGQEKTPSKVSNNADVMVGWNSNSVVQAVRDYAL